MSAVFRSERMGYTRCLVCGKELRIGKLAETSHARKHVREGKVTEGCSGRPYFNVTFDISPNVGQERADG